MEGKRRKSRESVLKILYSLEFNPKSPEQVLDDFRSVNGEGSIDDFGAIIINGVIQDKEKIDGFIQQYAQNWNIERIALIDKNIMRIAIYEMMHLPDVPHVVSINEAVDIAKKYSTEDSGKFVNGILDKINKDL